VAGRLVRMTAITEIFTLFQQRGDAVYFGEPITQTEHALQTAWQAAQQNASPALVAAALLHDVGHLLHQRGEDIADRGIDARHEVIGAKWLSRWFAPELTEPVRLHVLAKRYLCRVDAVYAARLSPASQQSLALQGGPLSTEDTDAFTSGPQWEAAVLLRRCDDIAKIPDLRVPPLGDYRALLLRLAR
jgi:phosphonate degradation associated HDIG domain protein